ncbi:dienelactone hydrolase family protein, partial [bacterium]
SVTFPAKDGTSARGFYVPGKKAAIVMCHEYWGLNDYIRREAERLNAATGYGVLAVDLYDGKVAKDPQTAAQYMKEADPKRDLAIVQGAVGALRVGALGTKYPKLGTIGWCFGGGWSLNTAAAGGSTVKAAVAYYGMPPEDVTPIKAPVLFVWATKDGWINEKVVSEFKAKMKAQKKPLTVLSYDADHAFANPSNPRYDATDAKNAWTKSVAFLKKGLG